ncbi:MAG TPA: cytochrome P450 [Vicinamibacteria bacterium]|jgi:cytochrome P450
MQPIRVETRRPLPWPPGPKGIPLLGSLFDFHRRPAQFLLDSARRYGDVVHYRLGLTDVFLISHPDLIKDVLVTHQHQFLKGYGLQWAKQFLGEGLLTSEGEHHTRQRRLSQPAFHRERIAGYAKVMSDHAARARGRWRDGAVLDLAQEMMQLTLAIVGQTLFDAKLESEASAIGGAMKSIIALFYRFAVPFARTLNRLPLPSNVRFLRAKARLDETIYRLIAERRREGTDRGDLLSMLLLARDEQGDGRGMTDLQLRDELMTLFLAGHETTANALTWTWYLLSSNPAAEARLHAEVDALGDRIAGFDDLPRLAYTERVFAETMRLYPPAWAVARRPISDYAIPGGGVARPGSSLVMSQYVVHRDPRYFPEPERFDPERWTPEARAARPKFSYFPFGGGARQCIGESFAWMEGVLLIATIAQRWRFRLAPGHPVEPEPLITLRPRYGMSMIAERRA